MTGSSGGEPLVVPGTLLPGSGRPTSRSRYVARLVAFGCTLVPAAIGLAGHRTGELVRLRTAAIVLAGCF